jgi:hypothetical protein
VTSGAGFYYQSAFALNWTAGGVGAAVDLTLLRDSAGVLAQRDGVNPQSSRVYNTYTNASNYERLTTSWVSSVAVFGTEQAGTGLARAMAFMVGGTQIWQIDTAGHLKAVLDNARDIGASGANRPKDLYLAGTATVGGGVTASQAVRAYVGTAPPAGGSGAGFLFSSTASFGVFFGSGAPTMSAAKGSLYLRTDGTTTNNRAYINTDGGTTWTAITTVA